MKECSGQNGNLNIKIIDVIVDVVYIYQEEVRVPRNHELLLFTMTLGGGGGGGGLENHQYAGIKLKEMNDHKGSAEEHTTGIV